MDPQHSLEEETTFTVLVTGANSGLGFAICCRLIDEFLLTRPQSQSLHLLYSTRDVWKSEDTARRLHAHLQKTLRAANGRTPGAGTLLEARVKIEGVLVDLTKLLTVRALARNLVKRGRRLDAVMWNAGIAGWKGVNHVKGIWHMMKGIVHATTYPEYTIPELRMVAGQQVQDGGAGQKGAGNGGLRGEKRQQDEEPKLGQVFLANVFGHYMLTHWLAPLLTPETRVVWVSSIFALPSVFNTEDIQGLDARMAYESSKRLTDLLVLTSELPSTAPYVRGFLASPTQSEPQPAQHQQQPLARPKMYLTHPGVIGTSIAGLNAFMAFWMLAAMYLSRLLGSPWHPVDPYKGAISAVYCALSPANQLPTLEAMDGKGKWGSSTGVWGDERVARTEVEGWGFCGVVGEVPGGSVVGKVGRYRGARETSREMREGFEEDGRSVWREMEGLRKEWEARLGPTSSDGTEDA